MAQYYISPTGLNTNSGLSTVSPWKTFAYAIPKLVAGDTLYLMDGTYQGNTTGFPNILSKSGQPENPITIKALNERKAFLKTGNGYPYAFQMTSCSYWDIDGLYWEGSSDAVTNNGVFQISSSNHINARHLLGNKASPTPTSTNYPHLMILSYCHHILVEESEFYRYARHAVAGWNSYNITYRRNYANQMGWITPSAPYPSGEGFSFYESKNSLCENNIGENVSQPFSQHGSEPGIADNNSFFGNIGIISSPTMYGVGMFKGDGRFGQVIKNTIIKDAVIINASYGMGLGSGLGGGGMTKCQISNVTIIGLKLYPPTAKSYGILFGNSVSTGLNDVSVTNALIVASSGTGGFVASGLSNWSFDYCNVYGGISPAFSPLDNHVTNATYLDPKLGNYMVSIPATSPMKGAGKNGSDIGANILFRYKDGLLTNEPLWDPITGEFPHGEKVAGVNDIPGQSAFDVHKRLGVTGTPQVSTGSISCTSNPSGTQIWMDGVNTGFLTPTTLQNIPTGNHTITFKASGYEDCPRDITVLASTTINVTCNLILATVPGPGPIAPIASWKFNEGSGNTALDSSGNGHNGTIYGATYTPGKSGTALQFNGKSNYVDCGNPTTPTNSLTILGWIKNSSPTHDGDIISKFSTKGYFLSYVGLSGIEFGIYGATDAYKLAGPNLADQAWHHVAGVYNGTSLKIFVDGVEYSGPTYGTVPATIGTNTQPVLIGKNTTGYGYFFGAIDEVKIYNRALTASEIISDMTLYPQPAAYWKFNEGSGNTALDSSGNGHNGTIYGATYTPGKSGTALQFNGKSNYVDCGNPTTPTNSLTILGWIKNSSPTHDGDIISKFSTKGYFLSYVGLSGIEFGIYGDTDAYKYAGPNLADQAWHHVAGVYNGTSLKIFVDGVEYSGPTYGTVPATIGTNNKPVLIGKNTTGNGYFFGAIDEVKIYNRALTPSEIISDMTLYP